VCFGLAGSGGGVPESCIILLVCIVVLRVGDEWLLACSQCTTNNVVVNRLCVT
jgi:hypothetical protein